MASTISGSSGDELLKDDVQSSIKKFENAAEDWGDKADLALGSKPDADDAPEQSTLTPTTVTFPISWGFGRIADIPTAPSTQFDPPEDMTAYTPSTINAFQTPTWTASPDTVTFDFDLQAASLPTDVSVGAGSAPSVTLYTPGELPVFTLPVDVQLAGVVANDLGDPGIVVDDLTLPVPSTVDPVLVGTQATAVGTPQTVTDLSITPTSFTYTQPIEPNTTATLPGAHTSTIPGVDVGTVPVDNYLPTLQTLPTREVGLLTALEERDLAITLPALTVSLAELPDPTALTLPELAITRDPADYELTAPTLTLHAADSTFSYSEGAYASTWMDLLQEKAQAILGGAQAIPTWVWSGIWTATTGDLERVKQTAYREADREHASRGWTLPGGAMLARRQAAKQQYLDAATKARWEQTLLQSKQLREDFFQALSTGLACEQILQQADTQLKERLLRAATETNNASIAALQASVSAYNAQVQWAQTEAQQRRLAFESTMADLEIFKANLDRLRLYQASDTWNLQRYQAEIEGFKTVFQRAGLEVQGKDLQLRRDLAEIDLLRANTDATRANREGDRLLVDEYTAKMDVARLQLQAADHAAKVGDLKLRTALGDLEVYRAGVEALKLGLESRDQDIRVYQAQWEGVKADLQRAGIDLQQKELLLRAATEANQAAVNQARANNEIDATAVSRYAAQWDGVKTEIQAASLAIQEQDLKLRAALGRVEAYKASLEKSKLFLDHDEQLVKVYMAQWGHVDAQAKAYQSWVDNVKNSVESNRLAVDAYSEEVKAQNLSLAAFSARWDAYAKQVEGARVRVAAHQSGTGLFAQQVALYQAQAQADGARVQADIDIEKLDAQAASLDLERFKAEWGGIRAKLDALTAVFSAEGQVYAATGQVEASRITSQTQQYLADIEQAKLDFQGKVETAKATLQYWQSELGAIAEWQKARAQVYATLGGAAYTAANVSMGASVGFDFNQSQSESTNYNYAMEG